jgi:hypothetical protein
MIVRRFGKQVHSVTPDFSAVALTEIAFRRDQAWSMEYEAFERIYARGDVHELTATADGDVQTEVESGVLAKLLADVRALETEATGKVLLIENEVAHDWPRLHQTQRTIVVSHENRLHFSYEVGPPLRLRVCHEVANTQ